MTCIVQNCGGVGMMCPKHWRKVPRDLRLVIELWTQRYKARWRDAEDILVSLLTEAAREAA